MSVRERVCRHNVISVPFPRDDNGNPNKVAILAETIFLARQPPLSTSGLFRWNTCYFNLPYRTSYRVLRCRFRNMLSTNGFRLIGLTWGESDESEILRPNREENGKNRAGNRQVSPIRLGDNEAGDCAESLCPHADNAAGRWLCPAACIARETVSG